MTILVDTKTEEVDLNQSIESPSPTPEQKADDDSFVIPDKFAGKSAEDIAKSYVELEAHQGQLANQLGDYRQMTDRFLSIEEKRLSDLGEGAPEEEFNIDPTELLSNPEKVLNDYYEHRSAADPQAAALQERLDRLEGQVGQNAIEERHADVNTIVNDTRFQSWVGENSFRQRIAQEAVAHKDVDALDYLLNEWKNVNPSGTEGGDPTPAKDSLSSAQEAEIARARSVATESSSSGSSASSAKRFSRRKLVDLKVRNPDEYAARGDEILRAYAEGRVDD